MFICERCLNKNYTNFAIAYSYGKCEECGSVKECCDIRWSLLNPKDDKEHEKRINYEYGN